jgi:hypothetical protein
MIKRMGLSGNACPKATLANTASSTNAPRLMKAAQEHDRAAASDGLKAGPGAAGDRPASRACSNLMNISFTVRINA